MNQARHSALLYLICCCIYGLPARSLNNISRKLLVEEESIDAAVL